MPQDRQTTTGRYTVSGTIRNELQQPMAAAIVNVYDKDIRQDQLLGTAKTGTDGRYMVAYSAEQFALTDLAAADIFIRVMGPNGNILKESAVTFNAGLNIVIDLSLNDAVYRGLSEYEQVLQTVSLYTGKLTPADLTEDEKTRDISFLTSKTNFARSWIESLVMAYHFSAQVRIDPVVFYGWLREGVPGSNTNRLLGDMAATDFTQQSADKLNGIMHENIDVLIAALQHAVDENIIPLNPLYNDSEKFKAVLQRLITVYLKEHPTTGDPSAVFQKLKIAGLTDKDSQTAIELLTKNQDTLLVFFNLLNAHEILGPKSDKLNAVFQLSDLTGNNLPLVEHLVKEHKIKGPDDLRQLAAFDKTDWKKILKEHGAKETTAKGKKRAIKKPDQLAASLEKSFAAKFPTTAFAARLEKDKHANIPHKDEVAKFIQSHEHFDLASHRIGQFIDEHPKSISKKDRPAVENGLKHLQRVFKLSPDYDTASLLLQQGVHSAQQLYAMGKDRFAKQFGEKLGKKKADKLFSTAAAVHAHAVAVAGNIHALSTASSLGALPSFNTIMEASPAAREIPDLDVLFQHADFCDCGECQSVYGAAAYLTDILHFLSQRMTDGLGSVRDRLLARRPDIGDIDLNCDNTDTELPYIDITNEILEETISPTLFTIPVALLPKLPVFTPLLPGQALPDARFAIDAAVLAALKTHTADLPHIDQLLTAAATVSTAYRATGSAQTQWIIRDQFITLKLSQLAVSIQVQLLHQTHLTTEELLANPEYTNTKVYNDFLSTAKAPFTLPFDLFTTEGEVYLNKLGINKSDLGRLFAAEHAAPAIPSTALLQEACDWLHVNAGELALIFTEDDANQPDYWGTLAASPKVEVDSFLRYTGIEYADLMVLINLNFINPLLDTKIDHSSLSCDLDKQFIINVTNKKFDHIHRFLRLWKKTTLSMQELDACIQCAALGNGNIDNAFALQLYQFLRLMDRFDTTVFPLLALYADIDHSQADNLYNQLFQNKQVSNPLNPDFAIDNVNAGIAITPLHLSVIQSATGVSPDDLNQIVQLNSITTLTLANLSVIYRWSLLEGWLSLQAADLQVLLQIIPNDPFVSPTGTTEFLSRFDLLDSAGFSGRELNYILRHQDDELNPIVPTDSSIAAQLGELQDTLLQLRALTAIQPDNDGALLTKWISDPLLNWDPVVANKLIQVLKTADDTAFTTAVIPSSYTFLTSLRVQYDQPFHETTLTLLLPLDTLTALSANINYNSGTQQLEFTGAMTTNERDALLAAFADQDYQDAVTKLFADSQGAANSTAPLDALPLLTSYAPCAGQLTFDNAKKLLRFAGYLSATLRDELKSFYAAGPVTAVLDVLFNDQVTDNSVANTFFANNAAVDTNLAVLPFAQLPQRFGLFISKIAPVYQDIQQHTLIQNHLVTWFTIGKPSAAEWLTAVPAIYTELTADPFVEKVNLLTAAAYPAQFNRYQQLAKANMVATKLKMDATALGWLLANNTIANTISLLTLPVNPVAAPVTEPVFTSFQNMVQLMNLYQASLPAATTIFDFLLDVAGGAVAINDLEISLSALFDWDPSELKTLIEAPNLLNYSLAPAATSDLKDVHLLLKLYKCFSVAQMLGASVTDCVNWAKPVIGFDDAAKIKQTLKSRYNDTDWPDITTPLQNNLREQKRDALVTWLLANPGTNTWKDANDLYSYFLIDVEMNACQPTSRIVQATNAVQQFVQRCFMAMETDITVNADDSDEKGFDSKWLQWQWMKYFRLWQANRKVFLYPENWIEPELLPNQSSFFKDLQNQLQQNEVTSTNAEDAFMAYLEKLDSVSRLEVKGMWYQEDNQTLHVIGRTYGGDPKIYYYRTLVENRRWTPWEKIDLDINSNHIVPVVFNNRIYLFWAAFSERPHETPNTQAAPNIGESNFTVVKPTKFWQVQMAFSEYKNGKWSPKKISNADSSGTIIVEQNYDTSSSTYSPDKSLFLFVPVDLPAPDFSNLADLLKKGDIVGWFEAYLNDIEDSLKQNGTLNINCYINYDGYYSYQGTFDLDPCKGYPAVTRNPVYIKPLLFTRSGLLSMLDDEKPNETADNTLAFVSQSAILKQTPGIFRNLLPLQAGFFDRLVFLIRALFGKAAGNNYLAANNDRQRIMSLGTFMPFFYQDATYAGVKTSHTYYVAPAFTNNDDFELFYSDIEAWFLQILELLEALITGDTTKAAELRNQMPHIPQGRNPVQLRYHFYNFYHPTVCYFMRQLFSKGIDGLMSRKTQLKGDVAYGAAGDFFDFNAFFQPQPNVYSGVPVTYPNTKIDNTPGYPREDVDFNTQDGYASYNWELFYHAPLMIAERLSENQQFDDADRWFRYIFNPSDTSVYPSPDKFWITKPFFLNVVDLSGKTKYDLERIENIMFGIANPAAAHPNALDKSVEDWRENPFQPHYIAQYRTVAYQKTTVMKYLDHLIRWGDYLFTQHTMESVTQATQIYVLAAQILGDEPKIVPPSYEVPVNNYYQLEQKLDSFSNVLVQIENLLPMHTYQGFDFTNPADPELPSLQTLYFCIPFNENILQYWKTIGTRLFNIRHCLDINGNYSPLQLFAPPIDPGLLVRATAAGLDLSSVLNDISAPLPFYRFSSMMQKATELCNEVKSLGAALLTALEKKDAEQISLLRSRHEIQLLSAVLQVKKMQVEEAEKQADNLAKQKDLIALKRDYYKGLLTVGLSGGEQTALDLNIASTVIDTAIAVGYTMAGGLKLIPNFIVGAAGFGGSPHATVDTGGKSFGDSAEDLIRTLQAIAGSLDKQASITSTSASYARRAQEWKNQLDNASKELEQIDIQILAAQIRLNIAQKETDNQQLQIDNAKEDDALMHSKFTNQELYDWMINKISTTYFQSYQLAFEMAKKAERCYRYELGLSDSSYIQFGYWDSMKKGLLSGESLMYNLKQLDVAYLDKNKREYELTKHISLSQLDPLALLRLKKTGECFINFPEEIYDLDYPGHYFRRIKAVSLSIPCVAGPYSTIGCTLTLMNNSIRTDNSISADAKKYPRKAVKNVPADDPRFRDSSGTSQSIVLSSGQNDSGLFELNFHDERYLPFEGSGAISSWHVQFPFAGTKDKSGTKLNTLLQAFDPETITDVIFQVKYTAREGGNGLKANASDALLTRINSLAVSAKEQGLYKIFSLKNDFPSEWYAFLQQPAVNGDQTCSILIDKNRFSFFAASSNITISNIQLFADSDAPVPGFQVVSPAAVANNGYTFAANPAYGSLQVANPNIQTWGNNNTGTWKIIKPGLPALSAANLKNVYVVVKYSV